MKFFSIIFLLIAISGCDDNAQNQNNNNNNMSCQAGDSSQIIINEEGGSVSLCGASVAVEQGIINEDITIDLTVVETPSEIPYPFEAGGPAFHVSIDGDIPASGIPALDIRIPHEPTDNHIFLFLYTDDGTWLEIEPCTADGSVLGQLMNMGGTYIVVRDPVDFPDSQEGLGSGNLEGEFMNNPISFDLDNGSIQTYAIYNQGRNGDKSVTISSSILNEEDSTLEIIRIELGVSESTSGVLTVSYGNTGDPDGYWGYSPFEDTAELTVHNYTDEVLSATLTAPLSRNGLTEILTLDIDITMELFRYPTELGCYE